MKNKFLEPKVYIIILNYNGWSDTIECLESVLKIDYPNYQVIVVDNNSPNNSMDYIKSWAEGKIDVWIEPNNPLKKLSFPLLNKPVPYIFYSQEEAERGGNLEKERNLTKDFPQKYTSPYPLIFIQANDNTGFAGGNNIAIKYALSKRDFEYVLLLNNDTVVERDFLSNLVNISEKENLGLTGCKIYYYHNPKNIWYNGGKFNEWSGRTIHIQSENEGNFSEVTFITGCCMLIRKDILDKIGLLEESFFMYVEDLDYSYKALKSGAKLGVAHEAKIYHKVGASSGEEITPFSAYWMMKNRVKFIKESLNKSKQITALIFLLLSRGFKYASWVLKLGKYRQIINAQIKGILDAFKEK